MPPRPAHAKAQEGKVKHAFDLSKWDNIDISDDETTFHPNIENSFNVKINRTVRDRRDNEEEEKKKELLADGSKEAIRELEKLERNKKWHVGNICHTSAERTIINEYSKEEPKPAQSPGEDEESLKGYQEWKAEHQEMLDAFLEAGGNFTTSEKILKDHGHILLPDNETKNFAMTFCMLECLESFVQGKEKQAEKCSQQSQMLQHIIELAGSFQRPPRDIVHRWFQKVGENSGAKDVYFTDVKTFLEKVRLMAQEKVERLAKEAEEEAAAQEAAEGSNVRWVSKNMIDTDAAKDIEIDESQEAQPLIKVMHQIPKEQRIACAPGALDPVEVFESLPKEMQTAFESQDVKALVKLQATIPPNEFGHHLDRCIKAGLWQQPGGADDDDDDEDECPTIQDEEDGNDLD